MLQYLITGLAGIALGIVGMRLWQAKDPAAPVADAEAPKVAEAGNANSAGASRKPLLIGAGALRVRGLTRSDHLLDDFAGKGKDRLHLISAEPKTIQLRGHGSAGGLDRRRRTGSGGHGHGVIGESPKH